MWMSWTSLVVRENPGRILNHDLMQFLSNEILLRMVGVRHYQIHPSRKRTWAPSTRLELIQTNIPLTQFRVTNLREDRTYQFRVVIKKLGHSPWLWSRIYRPELTFDPSVKPDIPTVSHVIRVQAFLNWVDQNQIESRVLCFRNQTVYEEKTFRKMWTFGNENSISGIFRFGKITIDISIFGWIRAR